MPNTDFLKYFLKKSDRFAPVNFIYSVQFKNTIVLYRKKLHRFKKHILAVYQDLYRTVSSR